MSPDSVLALKIALYTLAVRFGWSIVSLALTGVAMKYGFKPFLRWMGLGAIFGVLEEAKLPPEPPRRDRFYVEVSATQFDRSHDDRFQHSHVTRRGWIGHHMATAWMFEEDPKPGETHGQTWLLDMSTPLRVLPEPSLQAASVAGLPVAGALSRLHPAAPKEQA